MTDKINGPEASADGKRNAYHVQCQVMGHNRPFASCIRLCEDPEARSSGMYSECFSAIDRKVCPALQMRAEEREQHRAIYFRERNKFAGLAESANSFLSEAGRRQAEQFIASLTPVKSPPSRKSSVIDRIDTTSYADVISAEAKEKAKEKAPEPVIQKVVAPIQGESIFEMARRLISQSQSK